MRKTLLSFLLIYITCTYSQITFEKGYFISNSGQRTECFIKNLDWQDNPSEFNYKVSPESSDALTATIADIAEFGVTNFSKYIRRKVNIESSFDDITRLTNKKNPVFHQETLFLEVLTEGNASLYSYTQDTQTKFFFETKDVPLEQLVRIKYYNDDDKKDYLLNNSYRQQLFTHLKSGAVSQKDFENLDYDKNALIKVFNKYNNQKSSLNFDDKKSRKSFAVKITPEVNFSQIEIKDNYHSYPSTFKDKKAIYKFGFELEYFLPFQKNTWSLFINPAYENFNSDKTYHNVKVAENFGTSIYSDVRLKTQYSYIEVPIAIRHYFFLNKNFKIFVNTGIALTIMSKSKVNYNDQIQLDSKTAYYVPIGMGYVYKRYSMELRYNLQRDILKDFFYWSGKYRSLGIVFGYKVL